MKSGTAPDFVVMAEVVKAVGLRGEVKLYPLLDFHADVLDSPFALWQDGSPVECRGYRPSGSCVAIRTAGIEDRNGAEAAVGRLVGFRRSDYLRPEFPRPPEGLPFRYLGRTVVLAGGGTVGEVVEVRWNGGQLLLVIAVDGREVLVPAVPPILRPDQGLEGDLVIDPPEGLLDVERD
ncbi:MAG: ribosome maturation factor RimM [Candidatus Krumholzibacteriia bacterium]